MSPLATRARLLELEAEVQRIALGISLAQARSAVKPIRLFGSLFMAGTGWLLRRRATPAGSSWLLARLWSRLR